MKDIIMNSKIKYLPNYKEIDITDTFPKFICDKNQLEIDMKRILSSKGSKEKVDMIESNDIVLMSCNSDDPRFQRDDIYVIVGKNLYHREFEEKLIGLNKGIYDIEVENKSVHIEIKDITRIKNVPLEDAYMPSLGIDGVNTVEDLKRYVFNRQVDAFRVEDEQADMVISHLMEQLCDDSDIEIDPKEEEIARIIMDKQFKNIRSVRQQMIEQGEVDEDDGWEIDSLYDGMLEGTLRGAIIGCHMMMQEFRPLNEEDYENEIKRRAEGYNITIEEAKADLSAEEYAMQYYGEYLFNILDQWVGKVMKEKYYEEGIDNIYDVAILGSGPAGLSAALNLKLHNKSMIWFGSNELSDKVEKSEKIANYPGFTRISGKALNKKFLQQIDNEGLKIEDKIVSNITYLNDRFMVLADNEIYEAKTILLAIGVVAAKGFINEEKLLGRGVSYCATCDGFLYPGKTIAVYCGSKKYEHEVEYLAEIAGKVYLYTPYKDCDIHLDNVEVLPIGIREILGEERVSGIKLTNGDEISLDGVFIIRNAIAPATLIKGLEMDGPHIVVDRECHTNMEGIFAAGDCTGRPYQITKAVGEGNIAAHSIVEYLAKLDKQE